MFTPSRNTQLLMLYPLTAIIFSPILYKILRPFHHSLMFVEGGQLIMLFVGAMVSLYLAYQQKDKRVFWLWAMVWWICLFGRSLNWGRVIWPDHSRSMFRLIGIGLAFNICWPFLVTQTRSAIVKVIRQYGLPFKILTVLTVIFLAVDQIEHVRIPFSYLYYYLGVENLDLLEEVVETFFIAGLFEFIRFYK